MKKFTKLTARGKKLASQYIAEEIATGQYPRKQAIAIGISRAKHSKKHLTLLGRKTSSEKSAHQSKIARTRPGPRDFQPQLPNNTSTASHLAVTITDLDYRSKEPTSKASFEKEAERLRRAFSKSSQRNVRITVVLSPIYKRYVLKVYAPSRRNISEVQALLDTFGS